MTVVTVNASKKYDIKIGADLLKTIGAEAASLGKARKVCIVSDTSVFPLYGAVVTKSLEDAGFDVNTYIFPAGEESKNGTNYLNLVNTLAEFQLTRTDLIVALGGGVVGDLAGFYIQRNA